MMFFRLRVENFSTKIRPVSATAPKNKSTKRGPGRPATGRTTGLIRASVPLWLISEAKAAAFKNGESFSALVARAVHAAIMESIKRPTA
jgi:hypothetical protein